MRKKKVRRLRFCFTGQGRDGDLERIDDMRLEEVSNSGRADAEVYGWTQQ